MRPALAGTELPQVQDVATSDVRALAEHAAPGKDGSMLQNLGRAPTRVTVRGVATGPEALGVVERLKDELRTGRPLTFVADLTTDTTIEQVLLDDLQLRQIAGRPDGYAYVLTLREFVEPVQPEQSTVDADVLGEAADLIDGLLDGLDLAVPFSTGLESFVTPLSDLLGRLQTLNQGTRR